MSRAVRPLRAVVLMVMWKVWFDNACSRVANRRCANSTAIGSGLLIVAIVTGVSHIIVARVLFSDFNGRNRTTITSTTAALLTSLLAQDTQTQNIFNLRSDRHDNKLLGYSCSFRLNSSTAEEVLCTVLNILRNSLSCHKCSSIVCTDVASYLLTSSPIRYL